MIHSDFHITVTTSPAMTKTGRLALARLIATHIKRGLNTGTWALVDSKAIPHGMLHFYENRAIIETEEPCEKIAP